MTKRHPHLSGTALAPGSGRPTQRPFSRFSVDDDDLLLRLGPKLR